MRTSPKKNQSPNKENEYLRNSIVVGVECDPESEAKSPMDSPGKMAAADNLSPFSKSLGARRSRGQRFNSSKRQSNATPREFTM